MFLTSFGTERTELGGRASSRRPPIPKVIVVSCIAEQPCRSASLQSVERVVSLAWLVTEDVFQFFCFKLGFPRGTDGLASSNGRTWHFVLSLGLADHTDYVGRLSWRRDEIESAIAQRL